MKRGKAEQQNKTAVPAKLAIRGPRPSAGYESGETERVFAADLVAWQRQHGRHDLPWQNTGDAYRIWLSEVMLQQTQVATVMPYYARFLERFPDVASLAAADLDEVLRLWSGLGYYSRARNLHAAAKAVMTEHEGRFPDTREALETLPGVGRSTAAAISAFAYGRREAILDGNVKRVLARCFAVAGYPGDKPVMDRLWSLAESLLPDEGIEAYTQGLMDIGATVCLRKPECQRCPLRDHCKAYQHGNANDYPASRPKKEVRIRAVSMLVLMNEGKVLLARRPPTGVWANLWCFPELSEGSGMEAYCRDALGVELASTRALPPLRHVLTHFTMDISPTLGEVDKVLPGAASTDAQWVPLGEVNDWALPAPVRTLLSHVQGQAQKDLFHEQAGRPKIPSRVSGKPPSNQARKSGTK
ncbi:MAG TPA: A/G-specific adenine glycosylase [Burkholderiales bacterium]|nr:A/G-specific adenine glycosylase [Burkholderiales bacterium]